MLNKRNMVFGMVAALVLAGFVLPQAALAQGGTGGKGPSNTVNPDGMRGGWGTGSLPTTYGSTLDPEEEEALLMAIDDEYKALATYLGVMDQFGEVAPFVAIAQAEELHIAALERLFDRYGLETPENEWIGNTASFDSIADACAAGAQAEIDNAALYDQILSMVDNPDILRVFANLSNASEYKHLPAFSSCVDGDGTYVPSYLGLGNSYGGFGK